ncbi:hypothetical protein AB4571_01840 [Vibrio breoganii]|uniref:hypothetical protein n=1 Tax=Vibrio breoganii TaxID=553239 RepID=UPI000C82D233|nr:hypothetical protein [Vibrio breoganii]PML12655.1 hypothetical protein BCT84_01890 [Vibrio breoganii]
MSMFQCVECGCQESTSTSNWAYLVATTQEPLCSACDPDIGQWHGAFKRVFLPKGQFTMDESGFLVHIETGSYDINKYALGRSDA